MNKRKTMTLEEALDTLQPELSVYNDVFDEEYPTWCGDRLTSYGKRKYADLLKLNVVVAYDYIEIQLDELDVTDEELDELNDKLRKMFYDLAGYCSEDEYNKCFKED